MTPTPGRSSGNPAKKADGNLTVKQKREAERQEKLAEYQRNIAKRKRNKTLAWVLSGVGATAVVGLVIASFVFTPRPVTYDVANGSLEVEGVETFKHQTLHVEEPVNYEQTPPAGGPHSYRWLTCGIYEEPVPNENAVHSMEHGAVWVTYDPAVVDQGTIDSLAAKTPSTYAILSPYADMDSPITLSAWNAQLKVDSADDPRISEFFRNYWRSNKVPEPGALCTEPAGGWM